MLRDERTACDMIAPLSHKAAICQIIRFPLSPGPAPPQGAGRISPGESGGALPPRSLRKPLTPFPAAGKGQGMGADYRPT